MKEEKPRRCGNPECGKLLPIGNQKRKHCDKSCSNKAGHIARKKIINGKMRCLRKEKIL